MASNNGVPATMVIGGKTFNLAGLINESVLDLQMANVFKVLRKLNSLIETQASQIQALQTKVLEIDPEMLVSELKTQIEREMHFMASHFDLFVQYHGKYEQMTDDISLSFY